MAGKLNVTSRRNSGVPPKAMKRNTGKLTTRLNLQSARTSFDNVLAITLVPSTSRACSFFPFLFSQFQRERSNLPGVCSFVEPTRSVRIVLRHAACFFVSPRNAALLYSSFAEEKKGKRRKNGGKKGNALASVAKPMPGTCPSFFRGKLCFFFPRHFVNA